ncbi:MAG: cytochrome b [Burkholderiales bacterium]|nr:cytochrome b [Burkholderiales bacterium]MBS0401992.1 cytochrome b [Pseudomonadota bacterium]MBS0412977.1 cytochrome b [Pseudomonadota bacterium]
MKTQGKHYHPLQIGVHWLTLLLLIAVYALIELRDIYPKGSAGHELMKTWHFMLGMAVLAVVLVRLPLRLALQAPPITPPPPAWQEQLAHAMHWALYGFLIVMPLLGWLTLSAKGQPIPFFGLELPALMGPDRATARNLEGIHELIGNLGFFLIGLHAAAALWHHYFMRDDTLERMLPLATRQPERGAQARLHRPS